MKVRTRTNTLPYLECLHQTRTISRNPKGNAPADPYLYVHIANAINDLIDNILDVISSLHEDVDERKYLDKHCKMRLLNHYVLP